MPYINPLRTGNLLHTRENWYPRRPVFHQWRNVRISLCYASQLKYVFRLEENVSRVVSQDSNSLGRIKLTTSLEKQQLSTRMWLACVAGRRKGGWKVKMRAGGRRFTRCLSPFPPLRTPATQASTWSVRAPWKHGKFESQPASSKLLALFSIFSWKE